MPLISIVTVCRNAETTIADTLNSVASQSFRDYEHIIVDGASTDGTVDIIRSYAGNQVSWFSESDDGIADAMNKGIGMASGDYILFLHADDYFGEPDRLEIAASHLVGGEDIYAFDIFFQIGSVLKRRKPRGGMWRNLFKTTFYHQGLFCRRDLFDRIGLFNKNYFIMMDYDFLLRAMQSNASVVFVHEVLSVMRDTGISSRQDWPTLQRRLTEKRGIHRRLYQSRGMGFLFRLYWPLYLPYRRIRSLLRSST